MGAGPGLFTSRRPACSAVGNLAETYGLMVQQHVTDVKKSAIGYFSPAIKAS
jgi:hypothetical protein